MRFSTPRFAPPLALSLSLAALASLAACGGSTSSSADPSASGGQGGSGGAGVVPSGSSGSAGSGGQADTGPKLPCAVDHLVKTRCQECHGATPLYGAPMPLVSYGDLTKKSTVEPAVTIADRMLTRMRSYDKPMPQAPKPRATVEEIKVLEDWLEDELSPRAAGEVCDETPPPAPDAPPPCQPDTTLGPQGAWTMPKDTEDIYVCYGIDLPGGDVKRHITGIVPAVKNPKIVHHLLLFEIPKSESPVPHKCEQLFPIDWKAIYAWGPGTPAYALPEQAGFPLEAGATAHYAIQVHYSNLNHLEGEQDSTEMGLCTTDQVRPFDADIMWVGGFDFSLPAHKTSTVECDFTFPQLVGKFLPVHVFQAWPHMHKLGTRLETTLLHPDGAKEGVGLADPYDFNTQLTYPTEVSIYPNDVLRTDCTWNNTTDNKVKFGEATSEEMCFNLLAYYPRIPLPQYSGPAASYLSKCSMK